MKDSEHEVPPSSEQSPRSGNLDKEEIRRRLPLEWVASGPAAIELERTSESQAKGLCPFHDDHNPSLNVYEYGQRWKCFPCGKGGDLFDFVGEIWELDGFSHKLAKAEELLRAFEAKGRADGCRWQGLVDRDGPSTPVDIEVLTQEVGRAVAHSLRETTEPLRDLLEEKGLVDIDLRWLQNHWRLGVTPSGDVLASHWNSEGTLVSYKTRTPGKGGWFAKKGAPLRCLYGEWQLPNLPDHFDVVLCEGETDTWLASWLLRGRGIALGLPAGANSRIRDEWVEVLAGRNVVLCFDNDLPGRSAAREWHRRLDGVARSVRVTFPETDLVESHEPMKILEGGFVVPPHQPFIEIAGNRSGYMEMGKNGPIAAVSNFIFAPVRFIELVDAQGHRRSWAIEVLFEGDPTPHILAEDDLSGPKSINRWATSRQRTWYGSSQRPVDALASLLLNEAPFLPRVTGVPVAGLWGEGTPHPAYVLPDGTVLGDSKARARWVYDPAWGHANIENRFQFPRRKASSTGSHTIQEANEKLRDAAGLHIGGPVSVDELRQAVALLLAMNEPMVTTTVAGWLTAALQRKGLRSFPILLVSGLPGSGKSETLLKFMQLLHGFTESAPTLESTMHAIRQFQGSSNAFAMWWDEYRQGTRGYEFIDQVIRDTWDGTTSHRGGMGEKVSDIHGVPQIAPLVISGEAVSQANSVYQRSVQVRMRRETKNQQAFEDLSALDLPLGAIGESLMRWLLQAEIEGRLPPPPDVKDRKAHGRAVVEWGWDLFTRWMDEVLDLAPPHGLVLPEEEAETHEALGVEFTVLQEAILEAMQRPDCVYRSGGPFDGETVLWVDTHTDAAYVRLAVFHDLAKRQYGSELAGKNSRSTGQNLRDGFPGADKISAREPVTHPDGLVRAGKQRKVLMLPTAVSWAHETAAQEAPELPPGTPMSPEP